MSKKKQILYWVTKGGHSQNDIARIARVSKRDVSDCAKIALEHGLTNAEVSAMSEEEVERRFFPPKSKEPNGNYLQPDLDHYIERKKAHPKLAVKYFHAEYVGKAVAAQKLAYSYQQFCRLFSEEAERRDATRHFNHVPGAKAYVDWAGDVGHLVDEVTRRRTKVYLLVVELPFSDKFWAEGFCDTRQDSWQDGQADAFEFFDGVPELLVPDNAATATNHSAPAGVTLPDEEYERFAAHYGTAVLPTRVRKPRDKSTSESTVNLCEQWTMAPSEEMCFHTLEELDAFCLQQVLWLNARPFAGKDGSRDSVYDEEEREHMLPLPAERYVRCDWAKPKVGPDYHVQVDYRRHGVPHQLIGKRVDARVSRHDITTCHGHEVVARHKRLRGRRGQYSTVEEHMPENHRAVGDDLWSPERFRRRSASVGPECEGAIERLMSHHEVVQQCFVPCPSIPSLSKKYGKEAPGRACARSNELGTYPTYQGVKRTIESQKAADEAERAKGTVPAAPKSRRQSPKGRAAGAAEYARAKGGDA